MMQPIQVRLLLPVVVLLYVSSARAAFTHPGLLHGRSPGVSTIFYVSPDGKEKNPGTRDQPFGSVHRAVQAVRALKKKEPVTVVIRAGTYRLERPLVFTPEDSGTADAPVRYHAEKPGTVVLSGGAPIEGWEKKGHLWQAKLDAVRTGRFYFRQLFVNGRRAVRAVTPNRFYLRTAGPIRPLGDRMKARRRKSAKMGFRFREGDVKHWDNRNDVMIKLYHSWTSSLHWIDALDTEKRIVTFTNPCAWPVGYWEKFERYRIENYFEALDAPGEWYLDRRTDILSYRPRPGEEIRNISAVAPRLKQLLVFEGRPEKGEFVQHLHFKGLALHHTGWEYDKASAVDGQAHAKQTISPVTAVGLKHATFENCEIAHTGSHAVRLNTGCMHNRIARCRIYDCGGGGIYIGPDAKVAYMPPQEELKVQHNVVENNVIHDITRVLGGSIGIWVGSSSYNIIRGNDICNFNYTGISVGWCWMRQKEIFQMGNRIEYNHIHHNGGDLLSDNGGIYVLGYSPGSVIRGNHIHHLYHYPFINDSRGIYLDGNTSEYLVEDNLVHDIGSFGVTLKGQHNRVRNNIFAFCGDSGFNRLFKAHAKDYEYDRSFLTGNIVFQTHDVMTSGFYAPRWTEVDRNLYWSVEKRADVRFNDRSSWILKEVPKIEGVDFKEWKALGRDVHSMASDPKFEDAEGRDFRLQEGSPAERIGFKKFPFEKAGLAGGTEWTSLPAQIARAVEGFAPPPQKVPFAYDFESYRENDIPVVAGRLIEEGPCTIRTIKKASPGGSMCLQFSDGPASRRWYPHWYVTFQPRTKGKALFSCDLLNGKETPARFSFEFRDYSAGRQWLCGPRVVFSADGRITACSQDMGRFEPGTWMHMEVCFTFGTETEKFFSISVKAGNGKPAVKKTIPFISSEFSSCTWLGFSSLDNKRAAYCLDNVAMDIQN